MKTVLIASNNAHKAVEIAEALDFPGWEFKTLKQAGVHSDPVEDAETFLGNALIKAHSAQQASVGMALISDDSVLEVDALDGAPGVYSARYAGEPCDDAANNAKLLDALSDVEDAQRSARFVCHLVYLDEQGREYDARGTVEGRIAYEPQGDNGFGYDPLFLPEVFEFKRSLGQALPEEKNSISHRGNALRELRAKLSENA